MKLSDELLAELAQLSPAEIHELGRNGKLEAILRQLIPEGELHAKSDLTLKRFDDLKPAKP